MGFPGIVLIRLLLLRERVPSWMERKIEDIRGGVEATNQRMM